MTLILGVNLIDRMYLGADARVTYVNTGKYEDSVLKIGALGSRVPLGVIGGIKEKNHLLVAVAGNVKLATFLFKEIHSGILEHRLSGNPSNLRSSIEEFAKVKMDEWCNKLKQDLDASCCMIICGFDNTKTQSIDPKALNHKIADYFDQERYEDFLNRKEGLIKSMEGGLKFNSQFDITPETIQNMLQYDRQDIHLNPKFQNALDNKGLLLGEPANIMFSLSVSAKSGISIDDCHWGEVLAYGDKEVTKEDLSKDTFGHFEFSKMKGEMEKEDFWESVMIDHFIEDLKREKNIKSVSDFTIPFVIKKDRFYPNPISHGDKFKFNLSQGKGIVVNDGTNEYPLTPFYEFKTAKDLSLEI